VVVEAINVGLRIKLVKGPMQRFMAWLWNDIS
jgi:hypothetical protein